MKMAPVQASPFHDRYAGLAVGPQDNYENIQFALQDLRGRTKTLIPRNYIIYYGFKSESEMLSLAGRYMHAGLLRDLTVGCMQEPDIDIDG